MPTATFGLGKIMKIVFSHGKESGPWGRKIACLADIAKAHGHQIESIDYRHTLDPESRIEHLLTKLTAIDDNQIVLVGSSMGGYVSTVVAQNLAPQGLFLMAPAFYLPGYVEQNPLAPLCPVTIVHGWRDDIVPVDNAIRFARGNRCALHIIDSDHGLGDSLDCVASIFSDFIEKITID